MIRRHERAPARPTDRKARIMLSLGKGLATGNQTVTAANRIHDAHIVDIDKIPGVDIPSGDAKSVEV